MEFRRVLFRSADALVLRIWLLLVLFNICVHRDAIALLQDPDPDDAMRLAQVRDLIAGQGWFDIKQYRVNPVEGGGLMHWSRFVDAWIAGSVLALQPLLGDAVGERWALAFYQIGRASCREECVSTCRSRWSPYH